MVLYIAEKPSLGRAIADALPRPLARQDGYITTGNGDVVTWCIGHLLEQAEPDAYDPAFRTWQHEHLPIVPTRWQLEEKRNTAKQLGVLRRLVRKADAIVHAGDPDREGQLLVDEVLHHLGVDPRSAQRLLINDLNPAAVRRALADLRPNRDFAPLSTSALARARADWLYGINLTRAYTLQGRKVDYRGVLSVGRVQTPILGLVVRRDRAIEQFVSKPFYEVWAELETADAPSETFRARWKPGEGCARFLDDQGRNLSRPLAENVAGRVSHRPATVTAVERKARKQAPPLPHSLSSLQIDAAKRYRLPAQRVLEIAQALYERHKVITYPRSDSRHLPKAHHDEAAAVVAAIRANPGTEELLAAARAMDLGRRTRAWNDSKVEAHHAIIPTTKQGVKLSTDEARVYALVCRNYLAQFLSDHRHAETRVDVDIEGGLFVAKAREILEAGWKVLFTKPDGPDGKIEEATGPKASPRLPTLKKGQALHSLEAEVVEKHTTPPARFDDAGLLTAITGIAAHVQDPELRRILKETDGLGTEATRAGIIELLFRREFLTRVGKHIESTPIGRALIEALPEETTLPDMTARWESTLAAIAQKEATYEALMGPLIQKLTRLCADSTRVTPSALKGLGTPPRRGGSKGRSKGRGKARRSRAAGRKPSAAAP